MIKTPLSTVIGGAFWTPGATVINGAKLSFEIVMKKLFANGEQGFWYDPSDMGTMFQDAAGTTPVTAVGQPVGLLLDKSKGLALGPELITNGNFSDSSNWFVTNADDTHFVDFTADGARFYSASNTPIMQLRPSATLVPGKWYKIEVTTSGNIIGAIKSDSFMPGNLVLSGTQAGTYVTYAQARGSALFILRNSAVVDLTIKSMSVKELKGNHAYQTTSAARPILQNAPRRIDFDTVDDKLITNLPAQLTGCTVVRSVPGVGVQLLTNQTIPATYEDNKDHCGLIVINRALTPSETSAIAAEFNKRAGV